MGQVLTPELICDLEVPDHVDVSADGRWVTWSAGPYGVAGQQSERNVWLRDREAVAAPIRLTCGPDDYSARISPNGDSVAFLSTRGGSERAGVYLIPLGIGEARPLFRPGASVDQFCWSPQGDRLAVLVPIDDPADDENDDDHRVVDPADGRSRLRIIDTGTGDVVHSVDLDEHPTALAWRPDGQAIAIVAQAGTSLDAGADARLALVDLDGADPQWVCDVPWAEKVIWLEHEDTIAYLAPLEREPGAGSTVWAVAAHADAAPRVIGPDRQGTSCAVDLSAVQPAGIGYVLAHDLRSVVVVHDLKTGDSVDVISLAGDIRSLAMTATGEPAGCIQMDGEAIEVWAVRAGQPVRISDHGAVLAGVDLGAVTSFTANASDGSELEVIAIHPPAAGSGPWPTVVLPHGGPYGRSNLGVHCSPLDWGQWLAAAGYLVLQPNYRGGKGRGHLFAAASRADMGGADWLDVCGAVDTAIALGMADPDRLGIGGWSQGGFLSAWAVTQTTRFRAAVVGAGVSDWRMLTLTSDKPKFEAALAGGLPWLAGSASASAISDCSPITHVGDVRTPVLILHGAQDRRIPVAQGLAFDMALRSVGAVVETVTYPREPHVVQERAHLIDVLTRVRDWFDRHLTMASERRA